MGRIAHSRLDELRKCVQPMSWMDDDEVIDVLNELWSARETINDVSAKIIQDERQLAAQAAEIERLTKEAFANAGAFACLEGIHDQMYAELAALRSQLEEQRKRLELRANLAERDARERMVREQLDKAVADIMAEIAESKHAYVKVAKTQQPFWEGRTRGCELALIHLRPLRAALSAKSDEPTPTPTEPSQ